ncbi:unnamed protein product [Malus baccata var. baccata]
MVSKPGMQCKLGDSLYLYITLCSNFSAKILVEDLLQQAYFKCAHECFDRRRSQQDISNCVENCSVPVVRAQEGVENEMAKFQERLSRALMVCQDKFEAAKQQGVTTNSLNNLESCVEQATQDSIQTLPHLAGRLKASFGINH